MTENEARECVVKLKQYNQNGELKTPVNNDVSMLWDGVFGIVIDLFEEIQQHRAIGTIEEFKALKEKSEPKKPIKHGLRENKVMCPHCTNWLEAHSSKVFCCYCGRKLDWN